jgi:hypothetical protein
MNKPFKLVMDHTKEVEVEAEVFTVVEGEAEADLKTDLNLTNLA